MDDLFSLKGRNAVIVGGAGGIGRGLAEGFVRHGAQVAIADVNLTGLENAVAEIEAATGQKVKAYPVDTGQESKVQELVAKAVGDMGRVHVLVNAQGFNIKAPATEFPVEDWDKLFSVNVRGVMICCKHFAAHMVEQGGGKIINLSSIRGARAALGGNLAYCASKGAVDMLTRQLAVELATLELAGWGFAAQPRSGAAPERLNAEALALPSYEAGRPAETEACRVGDARFLNRRHELESR